MYPGIAATAAFITEHGKREFGGLLTIGLAYCFGIAFAIIVAASTSGGHFNPVSLVLSQEWWN
ncbi:MAG: aquaporin [Ktedonobacteraceae bacterium]|nr:aquaporin [Ktedonobacteraceae bacterium]